MNKLSIILFFYLIILSYSFGQNPSDFLHVNQFGYLTDAEKVAVISNPIVGYNANQSYTVGPTLEVREMGTGNTVFTGAPSLWNNGATHTDSGDQGWWFDFSALSQVGTYYVFDPSTNHRTAAFEINANPYEEVLKAAVKAFYYNRCNAPKVEPYAQSNWTDVDNFPQDFQVRDAFDQNNPATARDMSGGWFDAGDYNKYVTFAHDAVHNLLSAYEEKPSIYTDDWNIPESGDGIPDILNEIKWELDWLYKMVKVDNVSGADGSVHIKMGSLQWDDNTLAPPSVNTVARFYAPTCSSASLSIASINAHAAKIFDNVPGMTAFVDTLINDAVLCWNYYLPFHNAAAWETDCDDQTVKAGPSDWSAQTQIDNAVVAAVYLYDFTGEAQYSNFVMNNINAVEPIVNNAIFPRHVVLMEAMLHYSTLTGVDPTTVNTITNFIVNQITTDPNNFFSFNSLDLYRAYVPEWMYYWGSNMLKANLANICQIFRKYNVVPSANVGLAQKATELTHYFHGVNPQGIVYLSNMYEYGADKSANQIFHLWFQDETDWDDAITSSFGPAPGFLAGGPNQGYTGSLAPPANQPPQKSYLDFNSWDPEPSYQISEPAIYYQAAYVRLLSNHVNNTTVTNNINIAAINNSIEIFPNPTDGFFRVEGNLVNYNIQILDINGVVYSTLNPSGNVVTIDISSLPAGMFFIRVQNKSNGKLSVEKILKSN